MAYTATQADLNILRQGEQEVFLKVELLNSNFKVIDSLTGNIKSDTYSVDSESIQRRSYKADIVVTDDSFQIGRDKKIWLDKRIRVFYGVYSLRERQILWYRLGVFAYTTLNYSYSASERLLSVTCPDLMALYDGTLNGELSGYGSSHVGDTTQNITAHGLLIPAGEDIYNLVGTLDKFVIVSELSDGVYKIRGQYKICLGDATVYSSANDNFFLVGHSDGVATIRKITSSDIFDYTVMAKSYTIKQGGKTVTTIDIPKDMVVKSGVVQENPKGQEAGTYLVLTLANATEDTIYINVGKLVDIYTVKANATQIQLAIDSSTREISATIVAGSVGTAELADGAVVTAKIADGNVTKAKLAKAVQDSLNKADSALQEADVATLRTDVAANKASLAEGGATANAIKANKEAAAKAQGDVNALATRVKNLESVEYVEATEAEIKAMFPTA